MADFNPIRDLRSPEADPFNVPAGQSTEEIEDIRLRLVLTRNKTENIVKIIKNKGLVFKKDVETIQELQRRLRKTIPRIPILRGDASTEVGSQAGVQKRGGFGFGFNRFGSTRTTTTTTTKTSFPILEVIVAAILLRLGIKSGPKGANNITKFFRDKGKIKTKDFIKILEKEFAKTKNPAYKKIINQLKLSEATKLKVSSEKSGFALSSKRFSNVPSAEAAKFPRGINLTFASKKSNALVSTVRKAARKNLANFDDIAATADNELRLLKEDYLSRLGQLNPKRDVKQYNDLLKAIKKIDKDLIKIGDIRASVITKNAENTAGGFAAKENVLSDIMKNIKKGIEFVPGQEYIQKPLFKFKPRNRKIYTPRSGSNTRKRGSGFVEGPSGFKEKIVKPEDVKQEVLFDGNKTFKILNPLKKPQNISSLNIDTSATHFVIIKTDQA